MIAQLSGRLLEKGFTRAVVETAGIGFEVHIPMSTYDKLPRAGETVVLQTVLHVREDAMQLFGFHSTEEKALYQLLVHVVSGVGPKLALNVLSGMSPATFCAAVRGGDVKLLTTLNGIGKRSAERLVVELKDKLDDIVPAMADAAGVTTGGGEDAVAALVTLGFKQDAARKVVSGLLATNPDSASDELIRKSLTMLNR